MPNLEQWTEAPLASQRPEPRRSLEGWEASRGDAGPHVDTHIAFERNAAGPRNAAVCTLSAISDMIDDIDPAEGTLEQPTIAHALPPPLSRGPDSDAVGPPAAAGRPWLCDARDYGGRCDQPPGPVRSMTMPPPPFAWA